MNISRMYFNKGPHRSRTIRPLGCWTDPDGDNGLYLGTPCHDWAWFRVSNYNDGTLGEIWVIPPNMEFGAWMQVDMLKSSCTWRL